MTRQEWQQLAERWLVDAKQMLAGKRWSAAYYVAGYAVECGLKACIMARVIATPEIVFEDRKFSEKCWTHSLPDLVKMANLETVRVTVMNANDVLRENWTLVKDWSEQSRYETYTHRHAKKLYRAITDKKNGVMSWIRVHW